MKILKSKFRALFSSFYASFTNFSLIDMSMRLLSEFVSNALGYLLPAYVTYSKIQAGAKDSYNRLLVFWIVMACFSVLELFGDMLISWLPLYYESKICFIVWLSLPGTRGADKLYDRVISPYLNEYEEHIDAHAEIFSQVNLHI